MATPAQRTPTIKYDSVPLPEKKSGKYQLDGMPIGKSLFFPGDDLKVRSLRTAASRHAKKTGRVYRVERRTELVNGRNVQGARIWREK